MHSGNFAELNNSRMAKSAKAKQLAYLGDATAGSGFVTKSTEAGALSLARGKQVSIAN